MYFFGDDGEFDPETDDPDFYEKCTHEAAHAVVSEILLKWVDEVSIYDEDNPTVSLNPRERELRLYFFSDDKRIDDKFKKDYVTLMLAGSAAIAKITETSTRSDLDEGGIMDFENVKNAFGGSISDYRLNKHIERTDELVRNPYVWDAILNVSSVLLEYYYVDGSVVRDIVNEIPYGELMKIRKKYMATPYWCKSYIRYYDFDSVWYGHPDMEFISETNDNIIDFGWSTAEKMLMEA